MALATRPEPLPIERQMAAALWAYNARMRRSRLVRAASLAALAIGIIWAVFATLFYLGAAPQATAGVGVVVTVILTTGALLAWLFYKPSMYETARMLDSRLDDRQRMLTAVELLEQTCYDQAHRLAPLSEAQLASSTQMLAASDPKALYPVRTPWTVLGLSTGLLLLALSLFMLRGVQNGFTPLQAGDLPPVQNGASALLVSPTAQLSLPGAAQQTAQPGALSTPQSGGDGGTSSAGETQPTPSDPAQQAAASQQAQQDLNRLAQALNGQSASQQTSDSLRQGDYNKAASQLSQLGQQNDQLSDAAKQGLSDALNQAAQASSTTPDLQQSEQAAADALANGDYRSIAGAMKELGQAVQSAGRDVVPQQQLAKNYPLPTPPPDQGQQQNGSSSSSSSQQNSQGQSGSQQGSGNQQGQQGQSGQQGGAGQQGQGGQSGQSGQNGSQGQNGGQSSPSQDNEGQSKGGSAGDGTRVNGPKDDTALNVQGNPFELEGKPDPNANKAGQKNDQPALSLGGSSAAGGATSAGQGSAVTAPGESNNPPVDRRPIVQRYFSPGK
ncbi:MAG: hypothetical protein IVW55_03320 [Chloroflexi bacterium]|nr:hypothetical protein [Chloroflexota bacterium]